MGAEEQADRRPELYAELCRGWYIGTKEGKKALVQDLDEGRLGADGQGKAAGYGQERAEHLLERGLGRLGRSSGDT